MRVLRRVTPCASRAAGRRRPLAAPACRAPPAPAPSPTGFVQLPDHAMTNDELDSPASSVPVEVPPGDRGRVLDADERVDRQMLAGHGTAQIGGFGLGKPGPDLSVRPAIAEHQVGAVEQLVPWE